MNAPMRSAVSASAPRLAPRACSTLAGQPVDLVGPEHFECRVHGGEMVPVAEDVALCRGVGVVDVQDLHLGVLLLEPEHDLFQAAGVSSPPREHHAPVLLVGVLLGLQDLLDELLDDRSPERGVPVGGHRPVAAGGERRVQQQHALREHRLEPLRRLHGVLLFQECADVGDRRLLGGRRASTSPPP
ncbi:hypothetical protein ACFQX6_40580 [Streptosporangium lutulentum]